ncbi:MAG TPA: penicillin acylase family protein [Kineosporiaceae bacterium]|nr:penicillin acylase family protein [Kineosporiaceae bacterium]
MARRRLFRYSLIGLASLLVVVVIAGVVLGVVLVRRPFPGYGGEVTIPGLRATATVQRDEHGIPQIYADSPEDLFRAQGYAQAQDQFFAMDWRRHVTAGRLSELVGADADALTSDKLVRTLGWRQVAQQEEQALDSATRSYLQAFAAGVNDYLTGRSASQLSLNYAVLSVRAPLAKIEPWTVTDSLAWFQAMAWQLRGGYDDELARARVLGSIRDLDRLQEVYPAYPYAKRAPILSADETAKLSAAVNASVRAAHSGTGRLGPVTAPAQLRQMQDDSAALERALLGADAQGVVEQARVAVSSVPSLLGSGRAVGADAWVVSGGLTSSGKPLLADDPQLSAGLPGIWYQIGLHCRKVSSGCPFEASGYTFAGVPGVVIGHNGRVSWGMSGLGPDVTDYYLERVDGDTYERDGRSTPMNVRTETIQVAGGSPVTFTVRSTVHGPVVSDLGGAPRPGDNGTGGSSGQGTPATPTPAGKDHQYAVSIAWSALQPGHDAAAVFALDVASDFTAFRAAAQQFDVPAQNFVYADVDGHIGYQASGRIPVRRSDGVLVPGDPAPASSTTGAGPTTGPTTAAPSESPSVSSAPSGVPGSAAAPGSSAPTAGGTDPAPAPGGQGQAAAQATPARLPADGTWPMPGWNSSFDWTGYVPADQLPWVEDPADGLIVAANQPVTTPDYPVQLAADWDYGYRAQRIRDLVHEKVRQGHKLTAADLQTMQGDTYNPMAAELVPLLLQARGLDGFTAEGRDLLRGWDYTQPADSAPAAYYNAVWASLLQITFSDELPDGIQPDGGQQWFAVVSSLLGNPRSTWWDDRRTPDVVETEAEDLRQAMVQARLHLTSKLGKDPSRWQWGHLHRLTLTEQPLGNLTSTGPLHPLLNVGPVELGGSSLVSATGRDAASGSFAVTDAVSMRMVVDVADFDGSRWVNAAGESAHPGQAHYADQLDAWARDETFPWPFSADAVKRATRDTLTLTPGPAR